MARSTAAEAGRREGAWVHPSQQELSFYRNRRTLATLSDEQLRRKMDEFNDMFITVSAILGKSALIQSCVAAEVSSDRVLSVLCV